MSKLPPPKPPQCDTGFYEVDGSFYRVGQGPYPEYDPFPPDPPRAAPGGQTLFGFFDDGDAPLSNSITATILTWTTNPPTTRGWYWHRNRTEGRVIEAIMYHDGRPKRFVQPVEFAGPIPLPNEPMAAESCS